MSPAPLRILIVEDSEADTELLRHELRRAGYEPACERVETADALRATDAAMYEAKRTQRGFKVYSPDLDRESETP